MSLESSRCARGAAAAVLMALVATVAGLAGALPERVPRPNDLDPNSISLAFSNDFPHYSDRLFYIQFSPRAAGVYPTFSLLIFTIREGASIAEKGFFYPGFFYELEYPYRGEYFALLVATVLRNNSLNLRIQFSERANFKHFEIRYGEFESREKMEFAKKNFLYMCPVVYSRVVHLFIRTRIEMHTATADGRSDGLVIGQPGFLVCQGSRGYPERRVRISGHDQYEVIDSEYDSVTNTHRIKALFRLYDDRTRFQCSTDDSQEELEIRVFHHPTKLRLEPAYYNTVPNGSEVVCVADDGYPKPKVQWYFISGPFNHDWFFTIHENRLFMLSNAPINSSWAFKCVAENVIPNSNANSTSLFFKFYIIPSGYNPLVIIAASTGTVVALLALIVILFIILRPRRRHKRPPTSSTPVIVGKELAFDPDTAASLRLSHSTECLPDDLPKYQEAEIDKKCQESKGGKENSNDTCYV